MNGSNKRTDKDSEKQKSEPSDSRPRHDMHWDRTNLASQVQMMSDSLAACNRMSKPRPLRKMYAVTAPKASFQVLMSPEDDREKEEEHDVIVSYMLRETRRFRKNEFICQQLGCKSVTPAIKQLKRSSRIEMYDHGKMDSSRMVDVIRRELKELMEMVPPVALLATALSDTISHYKECDRCSEKISPSLPSILNRIQKLIKYVTAQRQGNYLCPDDYSYLRLQPSDLPPVPERHLVKSTKVEVFSAAEDIPGLQLLLEVTSDVACRKLFEKAENRLVAPKDFLNFSFVHIREPRSEPLLQVLLPDRDPAILLDERREKVTLREFAHAPRLVFAFRLSPSASLLFPSPVARLIRSHLSSDPENPEKTNRHPDCFPNRSNDRDFLARVPEIVREFLREAEEEKMHDQNVSNLEAGAKGLRDLMAEVHRNQLELSKVLLEKGVYSQPIIKLTDPDMLDKETELMRRVAELQDPGPKRRTQVSVEALQAALNDLKHKCALKNRVILIILKGLRSNFPKEWWEDMVEYVLEERKAFEDFDSEKVRAALERNGEQASILQGRAVRGEDQPSEEANVKGGIMGADVEERHDVVTAVSDAEGLSEGVAAVPAAAAESSSGIGTSIRNLEKQVFLLNAENERLRHEVEDLKNLLMSSKDDLRSSRVSRVEWGQSPSLRSSGKTISLTIEILDKDSRHARDAPPPPKNFSLQGRLSYTTPDASSALPDSDIEQELAHVEESGGGLHPSGQELLRKAKPEVNEGCRAGPSRRPIDVGRVLQKPSVMALVESECEGLMWNERELQTIPENECGILPSKGMSQAIQRLRSRVRSIQKDVTVLRSKNERIDKLLDKLVEDAVENGESFEDMESKVNSLREQLG